MDDPRSHTDPAALFGAQALSDLRSLKRSYARLIRAWGPEQHPEAFQHIRRLYELARATLESGEAVEPGPEAPDAAAAAEQLDALLASCDEDTLPQVLDDLGHLARVKGIVGAQVVELALGLARSDDLPAWTLAWHDKTEMSVDLLAEIVQTVISRGDADLLDNPALPKLIELSRPSVRFPLVLREILVRGINFQPEPTVRLLEAHEDRLRELRPDLVPDFWIKVLGQAGWLLDPEHRALLERYITDPEIDLDHDTYHHLQSALDFWQDLAQAEERPELAQVTEAARRVWVGPRGAQSMALYTWRQTDPDPDHSWQVLQRDHPTTARAIHLCLGRLTRRPTMVLHALHEEPAPPVVVPDALVTATEATLEALQDTRADERPRARWLERPVVAVFIVSMLQLFFGSWRAAGISAAIFLILGIALLSAHHRDRVDPEVSTGPIRQLDAHQRQILLSLLRAGGWWVHEVRQAVHNAQADDHHDVHVLPLGLLTDHLNLEALGPRHLARVHEEDRAAAEAAAAEAS